MKRNISVTLNNVMVYLIHVKVILNLLAIAGS